MGGGREEVGTDPGGKGSAVVEERGLLCEFMPRGGTTTPRAVAVLGTGWCRGRGCSVTATLSGAVDDGPVLLLPLSSLPAPGTACASRSGDAAAADAELGPPASFSRRSCCSVRPMLSKPPSTPMVSPTPSSSSVPYRATPAAAADSGGCEVDAAV